MFFGLENELLFYLTVTRIVDLFHIWQENKEVGRKRSVVRDSSRHVSLSSPTTRGGRGTANHDSNMPGIENNADARWTRVVLIFRTLPVTDLCTQFVFQSSVYHLVNALIHIRLYRPYLYETHSFDVFTYVEIIEQMKIRIYQYI